ncbi:restriction endonuclease [Brachyspira intermedia]|uniref:restriction endonuclease n=1 Tax=Brachyspira intermedia TaxID=84377 RepID=UPI0030079353
MLNFFELDEKENKNYVKLIKIAAKLSRLYSDSDTPYIYYRAMENLFCYCFGAKNLSRSDTAFDAKLGNLGIGLKTFVGENKDYSFEKIAEFNKDSKLIKDKKDEREIIEFLANLRNDRINLAKNLYGISESLYHIIVRRKKSLLFFETDYNEIDISNLRIERQKVSKEEKSLNFTDGNHLYKFNFSKSTLFRKFDIPKESSCTDVVIFENPAELLLSIDEITYKFKPKCEYVILPLYTIKEGKKIVQERSALNQWNAGGRKRDSDEVYIAIPSFIRNNFPNFFPGRDTPFILKTPIGEILNAKVCQDNDKALMTNPNKALSNWLLRNILKLKEFELATIERLEILGIDSVIITKEKAGEYSIDIQSWGSYERFIEEVKTNKN